jgi:hypothetical protein
MVSIYEVTAGVAQWQSTSFPSWLRGFDSLHPLQISRPCIVMQGFLFESEANITGDRGQAVRGSQCAWARTA